MRYPILSTIMALVIPLALSPYALGEQTWSASCRPEGAMENICGPACGVSPTDASDRCKEEPECKGKIVISEPPEIADCAVDTPDLTGIFDEGSFKGCCAVAKLKDRTYRAINPKGYSAIVRRKIHDSKTLKVISAVPTEWSMDAIGTISYLNDSITINWTVSSGVDLGTWTINPDTTQVTGIWDCGTTGERCIVTAHVDGNYDVFDQYHNRVTATLSRNLQGLWVLTITQAWSIFHVGSVGTLRNEGKIIDWGTSQWSRSPLRRPSVER